MTNSEALEICNERLRFCANLYGAKWTDEAPFLTACKNAMELVEEYAEQLPGDENPIDGVYLVRIELTFPQDGDNEPMTVTTTRIATFSGTTGWEIGHDEWTDFQVLAYRKIPGWKNERRLIYVGDKTAD